MNLLSLILPTHNRGSSLELSISSIVKQSFSNWELIVIDDASTDDTHHVVRKFMKEDPRISYYRNHSRQGQQKSKNKGVLLSKGQMVFFMEDDVILHTDCLLTLLKNFGELVQAQCDMHIGAIGPRLIEKHNIWRDKVVEVSKLTGYIYTNFNLYSHEPIEVPTLHACSLVNKEVFRKVGGFDEKLYKGTAHREETDFYYRARRAGFHLFFQPEAIAYHLKNPVGGCHEGVSRVLHGYYFVRNNLLFLTRFYGLRAMFMIPSFLLFVFFVLRLPSKKPRW